LGKPVVGDVVIVPFPFSDLTQTKRRPALVLADLEGDDLILCMITSRAVSDRYAVALNSADFSAGGLSVPSNIRPSRLFTADSAIIVGVAGQVSEEKLIESIERLRDLFSVSH
jgi:mRNA interferase MazF